MNVKFTLSELEYLISIVDRKIGNSDLELHILREGTKYYDSVLERKELLISINSNLNNMLEEMGCK